jgi:hypothetical protein
MAQKLGHNWLNAVFGAITLPDIHLDSTDSEMFRTTATGGVPVELSWIVKVIKLRRAV